LKRFFNIFIKFHENDIANRCLHIYFSLPRISNQFLARAYLCQFELLAPKSTKELVILISPFWFCFFQTKIHELFLFKGKFREVSAVFN
jgi:hypothetical protein